MKKNRYIIIWVCILTLCSVWDVSAQCLIESWPPQELTQYIQETRKKIQQLNAQYPNKCSEWPTPTTQLDKVISVMDKAYNQVPVMNNILIDFLYNVYTVARFESSPLVIRHGQLLYDLERSTIIPAIEKLASKCQLDSDAETEIIRILRDNNQIQDYFKNIVLWRVTTHNTKLEQSILNHYSEWATQSCKDNLDLSVWIDWLLNKTEKFWNQISDAKERWDQSIRLMRGWSSKWTKAYNELQTRLLRQELNRQWLWQGAISQMLNNLSCAQIKNNPQETPISQSVIQEKCERNYVVWLQEVANTFGNIIRKAKNSDEYIQLKEVSEKKAGQEVDVIKLYADLQSSVKAENNTDATTNTIITNLLNIHIKLTWLNMDIEKRIPKMKENCMKWSPDIVGWCN